MNASESDLQRAAEILARGGLVAFPTETVYGLGANAEDDAAVHRIFVAKGRPTDHPLIVHIAETAGLEVWASQVSREAKTLAAAFWPGPLTLILPRGLRARDCVTGGQATVGLRVPAHPLALRLLRAFGGGIAAPSANRFGAVSPTRAEHVRDDLGDRVDLVLDGGPCIVGIESTILDCTQDIPRILRPGAVSQEELEAVLGHTLEVPTTSLVRTSGQLESHYAPRARVRLVTTDALAHEIQREQAHGRRVGLLLRPSDPPPVDTIVTLSVPDDDAGLARTLYASLRGLDEHAVDVILTTLPPETGLGLAIADRLRKAAGPRSDDPR